MLNRLKLLDQEAQSLKTGCEMRSAELDNIRTIINLAAQFPGKLQSTIRNVQERLKILRERPDYAGNHEKFKEL